MATKVHELKIHPMYYEAIKNKEKTFEIRKNDRDFKVGDEIALKEYADGFYSHADTLYGRITYITDYEQKKGFVVMAVKMSCWEDYS